MEPRAVDSQDHYAQVPERRLRVCSASILAALIGASLCPTQLAGADLVLQTLYQFASNPKNPQAGLTQGTDGNFYGTTAFGGTSGENGTVFRITPNAILTTLFSFNGTNGSHPLAVLIQGSDGNFYGTTAFGGATGNNGTIFRITPSGQFTNLFSFHGTDGSCPMGGLVQGTDGSFYGTTAF